MGIEAHVGTSRGVGSQAPSIAVEVAQAQRGFTLLPGPMPGDLGIDEYFRCQDVVGIGCFISAFDVAAGSW